MLQLEHGLFPPEYRPGPHGEHTDNPAAAVPVPAAHALQNVFSVPLENCPALQSRQGLPVAAYRPGPHDEQTVNPATAVP